MKNKWIWVAAGLTLGMGGIFAACSSDSSGDLPTKKDSGAKTTADGSQASDGGVEAAAKDGQSSADANVGTGDSASSANGDANGNAGGDATPADGGCRASLKPNDKAGPYCPFVTRPDGGLGRNCQANETCCIGAARVGTDAGFDLSACVATLMACSPASDPAKETMRVECTETNDCATGQVCCILPMANKTLGMTKDEYTCTVARDEKGTVCKQSCGADEWQGCQADKDCPQGKTCSLVNIGPGDRIYMGYCK